MMDEQIFRNLLEERAQTIADDIAGDNPDVDVSYECYVFTIDAGKGLGQGWQLLGYIYMGECGEWAFVEDGHGDIEDAMGMVEIAKRLSPYAGW